MARDPYVHFRVEVRDTVGALSQILLALERGDAPADAVARLFRHAHTLKGAASVVRQAALAELAHVMEDVLAAHRDSGEPLSRREVGELLQLVDAIAAELGRLDAPPAPAREGGLDAPAAEPLDVVRVDVAELDALAQRLLEAETQMSGLRASLDGLARVEGSAQARRDVFGRLDGFEALLGQVREQVVALRLVPAGAIFPLIERAARDAAHSLGREVRCELNGGEVRIDRHVLSGVRDALLHIVRNAVDHGIEPPEARAAAAKPSAGRIAIHVERRARQAAFVCEDDGRGVDVGAVRRAAVARGVLSQGEAAALADEEALGLALRPGISTSEEVTELSGRGMGLDVARTTAARLEGGVAISSRPGKGTSVELVVPLSLTAMEALAVHAGDARLLVPLDAVAAALRVRDGELLRSPEGDALVHEGEVIPFVALAALLEQRARRRSAGEPWTIALLRASGRALALGVDRISGTADIVVHALPAGVEAAPWIAGATLDHDGNPVLVLDARGVIAASQGAPAARRDDGAPRPPRLPILVVDDSLTTRMLEQSILEAAGYEVDLACSAEQALEMAAARRYGLFLVDIEMPGMNGLELVARARADAALASIPVLLVTSLASEADRRRGIEAGAAGYIVKKEFNQRMFLERIGELLGGEP